MAVTPIVNQSAGCFDNLCKVAFSERKDSFLSRSFHSLYNQIAFSELDGDSIGIVTTLIPGNAKTLIHANRFRCITQYQVCSLTGPVLKLTLDANGKHEKEILPISLNSLSAFLEYSDYFWIPEPHLAMLVLGSESTLATLCRRSRFGLIITLPIQSDSIYTEQSMGGSPCGQDYEQFIQLPRIADHDARLTLHNSGFNFVYRFSVHELTQKTSEYSEAHGLKITQVPLLRTDHSKVAYETLFATPRANCNY